MIWHPHRAAVMFLGLLLPAALAAGGCADSGPVNASFAVSSADARRAMREMADQPKTLERPVVVLSGFNDPGFASW
ncbi:MAG: hypothetical protein M3365_10125, partial [Gemmatimonadota bacterium]|nr:hypothetical protein [Gemmatimonadota bacterium]